MVFPTLLSLVLVVRINGLFWRLCVLKVLGMTIFLIVLRF